MTVLRSYSNCSVAAPEVVRPTSAAEWAAAARRLADSGQQAAQRASGGSFDSQALHRDKVILLSDMPAGVRVAGGALVADGAARLGAVQAAARQAGGMIGVLPTSKRISIGGAVASNAVARFSARFGRLSDSLLSVTLCTPSGRQRTVRRPGPQTSADNDRLFRALPGSFGYLGLIQEVRLEMVPLPGPAPARVETALRRVDGIDPLIDGLAEAFLALPAGQPGAVLRGGRGWSDDGEGVPWAVTSPDGVAALFRSRVVATDAPLDPFFMHQPEQAINQLGHALASASSLWGRLGWGIAAGRLSARRGRPFIDTLDGFTFMMDGNWSARDRLGQLGMRPWLLQQTYVLPLRPGAPDPARAPRAFLRQVRDTLRAHGVVTDVIDLLPLCAEDHPFSSTPDGPGIAISTSFQGLSGRLREKAARACSALSRCCAALGGRIHLTKNVLAEPEVLREMFAPGLAAFLSLKADLDPAGVLHNDFLARLIGQPR